jgi:hypothetical protein
MWDMYKLHYCSDENKKLKKGTFGLPPTKKFSKQRDIYLKTEQLRKKKRDA